MQQNPLRPSACPGLLRIVPALDGGICRIKLPRGQLLAIQARRIADTVERDASGIIEITNRANLQLRGVRADRSNELIEALLAAELGPQQRGADDIRNLMVSPSAGLNVEGVDVASLADSIWNLLQTQPRFQQLSPKFAILLDGGERLAMLEHPHDLWLSPAAEGDQFVFGLAGCPARTAPLAAVAGEHAVALVAAVLHAFLDLATPEQPRLRHLLQTVSPAAFLARVQTHLTPKLSRDVDDWRRRATQPLAHIGVHPQHRAGLCYVGAVPALGRIDAGQLRELADLATRYGDGILRLTPWQSVLLPNIPISAATALAIRLQALGLNTRSDEPLAHLIACTGSSGCGKGLADTKTDALRLGALLREKGLCVSVHLTGCARSCAAAHIAPYTLLAIAEKKYDLFRRDIESDRFGKRIASAIAIEQAVELLEKNFLNDELTTF